MYHVMNWGNRGEKGYFIETKRAMYWVTPLPEKGYWTRIGAAWAHADSNGFNIQIKTLALDGRITLRIASEKSE